MRKLLLGLGAFILVGIGGYYAYSAYWPVSESPAPEGEQVFCTMDAKLCPDGSYVGRTGPLCEFAACPGEEEIISVTQDVRLNEEIRQLDVILTPLEVLEDSRCPLDVQCIQAGTVRIKAKVTSGLGDSTPTLELNVPFTTEAETILLVNVSPAPNSTRDIKPGDYVFTFEISKR